MSMHDVPVSIGTPQPAAGAVPDDKPKDEEAPASEAPKEDAPDTSAEES